MPKGQVIRLKMITREYVQENPEVYFVFGDNLLRRGMGGQAGAMRGEPNAIGVPTKMKPGRNSLDYFDDYDWNDPLLCEVPLPRRTIEAEFMRIENLLAMGYTVVIPTDGLGTGLSELPTRAPIIHAWIEQRIADLAATYPDRHGE